MDNILLFRNNQDYKVFLYYLKSYLTPLQEQSRPPRGIKFDKDYALCSEIKLLCYCLMPNHFHLMIQQMTERAISEFMRRLINAYTKYYNREYKRRGPIFEGKYKAKLIEKEEHFLYLPYYIHHNPEKLNEKIKSYPYSSYGDYLGTRDTKWIYKKDLMEQFVEAENKDMDIKKAKDILGKMILE